MGEAAEEGVEGGEFLEGFRGGFASDRVEAGDVQAELVRDLLAFLEREMESDEAYEHLLVVWTGHEGPETVEEVEVGGCEYFEFGGFQLSFGSQGCEKGQSYLPDGAEKLHSLGIIFCFGAGQTF